MSFRKSFALLVFLSAASGARADIRDKLAELRDDVMLGFRVMRLAARAPDSLLILPVRTARVERITDTWHATRPGGRVHEGQDIFAPRGTPVHSATPGYVTRVAENRLGGKTVWVTGAGRRLYYYAHLDGYRQGLRRGERVETSTVLGYVGTSGNARGTPPHLHFGVYTVQGAINPLPILMNPASPEAAPSLRPDSLRTLPNR